MSFLEHVLDDKNRKTTDSDFLFLSENDIPINVTNFKKVRKHAFRHINTHVEIETLTHSFLSIDENIAKLVFDTAYDKGDYKIASPSAIIALKLYRLSINDINDIKGLFDNYIIDLKNYIPFLSDKALKNLSIVEKELEIKF